MPASGYDNPIWPTCRPRPTRFSQARAHSPLPLYVDGFPVSDVNSTKQAVAWHLPECQCRNGQRAVMILACPVGQQNNTAYNI
jgi:hypothetical protein